MRSISESCQTSYFLHVWLSPNGVCRILPTCVPATLPLPTVAANGRGQIAVLTAVCAWPGLAGTETQYMHSQIIPPPAPEVTCAHILHTFRSFPPCSAGGRDRMHLQFLQEHFAELRCSASHPDS